MAKLIFVEGLNKKETAAISLAESIVGCEERLHRYQSNNTPAAIIDVYRKRLGTYMERLADNGLAAAVLPQVRKIAEGRARRMDYIASKTLLGTCLTKAEDLRSDIFSGYASEDDMPLEFPELDAIDSLMKAIDTGDRNKIGLALFDALTSMVEDLVYRSEELPPLPPKDDIFECLPIANWFNGKGKRRPLQK